MKLTRRETHVCIVSVIAFLAILLSGVSQEQLNEYELAGLFFFVLPLGVYILTDPERREKAG